MSDLVKLEENYKRLSNVALLNIAHTPQGLHQEALSILRNELIRRNEIEEVQKLDERLMDNADEEFFSTEHLSPEEIDAVVKDRLAAGESMESIAIKLKENGVNFFGDLEKENEFHEQAVDHITQLRKIGHSKEEIIQSVKENFLITDDEADVLQKKLKSKGKAYLILGYPILIATLIFLFAFLASNQHLPVKGLFVFGGAGIWLVFRGHTILREV